MAETTVTVVTGVTIKLSAEEAAKLTVLLGRCFSPMLEDVYMALADHEDIHDENWKVRVTEGGYIRVEEQW